MPLAYYIYKYPYKLIWHILKTFRRKPKVVFYCADPIDFIIFKPVQKYLPEIPIVAKNKRTANYLKQNNIKYRKMPSFPDAVIMCRHAAHKFPERKIVKVGMRHGAYHFKRFTNPRNYNAFDLYLLTSSAELKFAKSLRISSAKAVGFPKLDSAFDGTYDNDYLINLKNNMNLDKNKKTVVFSATWDKSGMSAIDKWYNKLDRLSKLYNILVTVHPWTLKKYIQRLKSYSTIYFIESPDILPYLMIADVLVSDTSSIIGEFCALDKPIITFRAPLGKRSIPEIREMIKNISIQINDFEEIYDAIKRCLKNPMEKSPERKAANKIMFDNLDGKAGKRAAGEIEKLLKEKGLM